MRSSSTKQLAENNRGLNGRFFTLHSRLYNALGLGLRNDEGGRRWCCTDVETQRHVVRSIDAFLDCISSDTSQHPLIKESVADIVPALGTTLLQKNEAVMKLASKVFVKMVNVIPNSIIESCVLDVVHPVSSSLSSCHVPVVISCSTALNLILSYLSSKRDREVWKVLEETETIDNIIHHIRCGGSKPAEFFLETISLLSKILWRWPSSRFCVWNDDGLLEVLGSLSLEPILSVRAAVLQLYSTIALCSNGAKKLLDSGKPPLRLMVESMDSLNPNFLQLAGFTLAECFAANEEGRLKMIESYCEPLVKAIIHGLSNWSLHSGKLSKDQMSLIKGACCVSKIICWPGKHHSYFWKLGIESVLLKLFIDDFHIKLLSHQFLSSEELEAIARDCLSANFLPVLKPHVWDILGGLAANCAEDFNVQMLKSERHLNFLITCACLGFVDSFRSTRQSCQNAVNEPVSRAVLLMIYSPSKYIASEAKSVLSGLLKLNAKEDIKYILNTLNATSSGIYYPVSNNLQVINLISLACYSGLPQYRRYVLKNQGIKILFSFVQNLSRNHVHTERMNTSLHFCDHNMKMCCYECEEDWQGEEMFLLFGLLGLAELVHHLGSMKGHVDWFVKQFEFTEAQIITKVQEICINSCASGPRWYGSYLLSYFGFYGFPSKLGNMIGNVFSEDEHTNLTLILANQEHVNAHGVIVRVRCPSLLPSRELPLEAKTSTGHFGGREVRLSAHVNHQALLKLLEYVYSGHLRAGEDLVKRLRTLAKHCNLQPLLQMLCRNRPKWRTPVPSFDLTSALGPNGFHFSDIILEAKGDKFEDWMCEACSLLQPHLHAHKVILCASCDHMRALLCSGMQESQSESIKVDLGWEALVRLVNWFYSGKLLPKPKYGCLWHNLNEKEKFDEVIPYVELYCLSDSWLLEDLHKECSRVIAACLDSVNMAIKIIQIAAVCFQWDLVDLAAKFIAPHYHRLRNSGDLLELHEELVDVIRVASVRLSQRSDHI
ncbi:BTB/POZ domain-containing protein At1g04390 isoform X1 [Cynara cardunculus var. scolymus]|uniref:Armadillo-like helical n=1 Tax=Cynara cardunculus var. scolymus TaxID=59895 RepID=A0A103Y4I6_CYNCS|nr:BTB/POZ domain-containing protein At1g04390 isoform X1 [Cynara cardunculus var. scolymus]XP_024959652.1 BTB/POZ domain-containing protein At1g04390 isoform X1 [Cynara cardunculus var. scolymus]XP_024959653.1 BTB/POZ domain-containing protein At1g04390 isoform X1 [Cynara cardunculus var. scolymus]XP_024959655.1 BTB/POZ domain-containing protein At1g04390 isoform X1 [Cynara cardunculus var. scolymus]XP_024959656.1 BTB/POZ domain-containing protein At1g04390 isoform X1 [Cynara cardunculus var. 